MHLQAVDEQLRVEPQNYLQWLNKPSSRECLLHLRYRKFVRLHDNGERRTYRINDPDDLLHIIYILVSNASLGESMGTYWCGQTPCHYPCCRAFRGRQPGL